MNFHYIEKDDVHLRWAEFGSGPRLLLAFHGFNRSPEDFRTFERFLRPHYTILAFDLFFHGESILHPRKGQPFISTSRLVEIVMEVLNKYHRDKFELIAYSFGGRIALSLFTLIPERVNGIYLMAPDGLKSNAVYWFFAQTIIGRIFFRWFLKNPRPVSWVFEKLLRTEIFHPKALEFYYHHLSVASMRKKVFDVWTAYRKLVPDRNKVARISRENNIPFLLFFGKHDAIIPVIIGEEFVKMTASGVKLYILDCGHRVMECGSVICSKILEKSKA